MRTQGSLEYLIIIAVVLAVSAIVIMYTTGIIGGQKSSVSITSCKQAAIDCKLSKMSSPTDPCSTCDTACKDSTGTEVSIGASGCCKHASPDQIYVGSPGCSVLTSFFSDSFANLDAWTGDKSSSPLSGWIANQTLGHSGSNSAYINSYGPHTITSAQSTAGYSGITVSFWAKYTQTSSEYLTIGWFDGTTWTQLVKINVYTDWNQYSFTLPQSADNSPDFAVNISCYDSHQQSWDQNYDYCAVDDFTITGNTI